MTGLLKSPYARLAGRALVAGAAQAILALQHSHTGDATIAWKSAATAGALAFCEVFTPLNPFVGVFKKKTPLAKTVTVPLVLDRPTVRRIVREEIVKAQKAAKS